MLTTANSVSTFANCFLAKGDIYIMTIGLWDQFNLCLDSEDICEVFFSHLLCKNTAISITCDEKID